MSRRSSIHPAVRWAVLNAYGHVCQYCGEDADSVDHLLAVADGGDEGYANLVAACRSCNSAKGKMPYVNGVTAASKIPLAAEKAEAIAELVSKAPKAGGRIVITFRHNIGIVEALEKAAKDDVRSVSSLMEKIVTQWLREKGFLPK